MEKLDVEPYEEDDNSLINKIGEGVVDVVTFAGGALLMVAILAFQVVLAAAPIALAILFILWLFS